jgi:hypothetical protein
MDYKVSAEKLLRYFSLDDEAHWIKVNQMARSFLRDWIDAIDSNEMEVSLLEAYSDIAAQNYGSAWYEIILLFGMWRAEANPRLIPSE